MLIKDFLDEVCDELQFFTEEFRTRLLRKKLQFVEDKVLNATDLLTQTFKTIVGSDLKVKLPYDFRYPKNIKVNDETIYRYEANEVADTESSFSIENERIVLEANKVLRLKPADFEYINIPVLRSDEENGYGFRLVGIDALAQDIIFGEIFDNQNKFYPENYDNEETMSVRIQVYDSGDDPAKYTDVYRGEDKDIIEVLTIYGLYYIVIDNGATVYYLAENGFSYQEAGLINLISRGSNNDNVQFIKFNEIVEDDEVEIYYASSPKKYISENQIDVILDKFKSVIFNGMVAEGFKMLKKPNKAKEYEGYFTNELQLARVESGKVKNFGKEKRFIPKNPAYRLPARGYTR